MAGNSIFRVPPEIWEKISEKIHSSKDLVNLAKVIPAFGNAVFSKRVEWSCYQILPILVTNIYCKTGDRFEKDFLNCRLVCKHWKFAVDNFLENNVLHYPASGDDVDWKLNKCHFGQRYYLSLSGSIFRPMFRKTLEKLLNEATNHPNNPIVGGHVGLFVPEPDNRVGISLAERFLETFGRHISFLEIYCAGESDPILFLTTFLRLLQHLPNLKGLAIHKSYCGLNHDTQKQSLNYLKRELTKINKNTISTKRFRYGLPKLETLSLNIEGRAKDLLKSIIINMFRLKSVKSLTVVNYLNVECITFSFPNLLHLSLNIKSNNQLQSVLAFNCPNLRKLDFGKVIYNDLDYDLLYKVLQKFASSINNLALGLPNVLEVENCSKREKMNRFFTKQGILKMPNIKTVSLFGRCPPSLNFLCGDGFRSLECFNLYYFNTYEDDKRLFYYPLSAAINAEITDIIQNLAPLWTDEKSCTKNIDLEKSNIWTIFPRLKIILIDDLGELINKNGWTYRRNNVQ